MADFKKMAALLNLPVYDLMPRKQLAGSGSRPPVSKVSFSRKVPAGFPALRAPDRSHSLTAAAPAVAIPAAAAAGGKRLHNLVVLRFRD